MHAADISSLRYEADDHSDYKTDLNKTDALYKSSDGRSVSQSHIRLFITESNIGIRFNTKEIDIVIIQHSDVIIVTKIHQTSGGGVNPRELIQRYIVQSC